MSHPFIRMQMVGKLQPDKCVVCGLGRADHHKPKKPAFDPSKVTTIKRGPQ